ncbi:MAG: hypothetical protein QXP77_03265 [Candidatus Aenigmatarchaeota archaeon]
MNKLNKIYILILIFIFSLISLSKQESIAFSSNQTNVSIQISEITKITVLPSSLSWTVLPKSEGGVKFLEIKNTGSTNITLIYAYPDTLEKETENPIGAGSSEAYSSGGVVVLKKNESNANWYYAGRIEWNISKPTNAGNTKCQNAIAWGYYRNVTGDYLWCLIPSDGFCNSTSAEIYIENEIDTGSQNTRDPEIGGNFTQASGEWGIYNFSSGPLEGHCVASYYNCSKIYIYRYDLRTNPNFAACDLTNIEQSLNSTSILFPSNSFLINIDVWVPEVPYGWMKPSLITIEAG